MKLDLENKLKYKYGQQTNREKTDKNLDEVFKVASVDPNLMKLFVR